MAKRRRNECPERQALREMVNGYLKENPVKNGTDVNALMRKMMSVILEGSLDGEMELDVPRDRNREFEPKIVKKYQNTLTQDMEEKIISMYAKGMTTGDIESHMQELYGVDISDSTISRITDKILPIVKEWQERPLEDITTHYVCHQECKDGRSYLDIPDEIRNEWLRCKGIILHAALHLSFDFTAFHFSPFYDIIIMLK